MAHTSHDPILGALPSPAPILAITQQQETCVRTLETQTHTIPYHNSHLIPPFTHCSYILAPWGTSTAFTSVFATFSSTATNLRRYVSSCSTVKI